MKLRNDNPLSILGHVGERITVRIAAFGTRHLVSYSLTGGETAKTLPEGHLIQFELAEQNTQLDLAFHFSEDSGGLYDIATIGGGGATISTYSLRQSIKPMEHLLCDFSSTGQNTDDDVYRVEEGQIGALRPGAQISERTVERRVNRVLSVGGDETKGDYGDETKGDY